MTLDHLLLGILREEPTLISDEARETTTRALRDAQVKGNAATDGDLPLSQETKRVWIAAAVFADDAGRAKILRTIWRQAFCANPTPAPRRFSARTCN
jgi:hypothetical protein